MTTYAAVPLASLTTLRLGGPARRLVRATTADELVDAVRVADADREPVLLVGGGSNLVIADAGFPGTAVEVATTGLTVSPAGTDGRAPAGMDGRPTAPAGPDGRAVVTVEAGETWDTVVERTLAEGLSGLECLSGIPGRAGAVPVQNVGAYGVEIAERLVDVDLYDRTSGRVRAHVPAAALGLAYRTSVLKGRDDAVVLRVRLALDVDPAGAGGPVRYAELARTLGVRPGEPAPPSVVRSAVLGLRRSKGMVLDADDHDTWSVGSFFTNPIVDTLPPALAALAASMPSWPQPDGRTKLSAAWLISNAGFDRGHPGPAARATLSTKHSLALTNRGTATTGDLLALAREVRDGVHARFAVALTPEPVLVACSL